MNDIVLLEPTTEYIDQIKNFVDEVIKYDIDNENQFAGCLGINKCKSINEWIDICRLRKDESTCSLTGVDVPSHMFIAVRISDNRVVGMIDLRHHINHPVLGAWGGHVGYTVLPSLRGKGIGKIMLKLDIDKAKELGIKKMLVTCHSSNIPSRNIILANGGIYEKTIKVDEEEFERYWILV